MRRGATSRLTMAEADRELSPVQEEVRSQDVQGEVSPCMPHLEYDDGALDQMYPALVAPEDGNLEDFQEAAKDHVLQHGFGAAAQIREQTKLQGRKRRPDDI